MDASKRQPLPYGAGCTVKRRWLSTSGTIDLDTGKHTATAAEWVTQACNGPLFSDTERSSGQCTSCASGWAIPTNYRLSNGPPK